ncbi:hypothetical protein FIBSPDRAFT_934640, partial [Athelia psychrophila]
MKLVQGGQRVNARAQQRCVKRILKQLKIALKMALVHLLLFLRMPTGKPSHSLFVTSIGIVFRSIYQKQDQPLLTLYRDRCAVSSRLPHAVLRSANPEWASVGCRHEASLLHGRPTAYTNILKRLIICSYTHRELNRYYFLLLAESRALPAYCYINVPPSDVHIIVELQQHSTVDGPNHLPALRGSPESQIVRIAHTCSRRLQWVLCMAGMGLENIAFITSETRDRGTVSLDHPTTNVERSYRASSVQAQDEETQILTDHLTYPFPIMAIPVEKRSTNMPLVQASQHGMHISVENRGGADNLRTQMASDDELSERIASTQTFNTAGTSHDARIVNVG